AMVGALRSQVEDRTIQADKHKWLELDGKLKQTRVELEGAEAEYQILKSQVDELTIRAPISGQVTTFQVAQMLLNRPVERGDVLLEVMDLTKDWRLELEVPEYRLGHIIRAQKKEHTEHLPVKFVLATESDASYQGKVEEIATRAVTAQEEGSIVE